MTGVLLTVISFFCIAILAVIAYKMKRTLRADATWSIFAYTAILVIAVIALDLSWRLLSLQETNISTYAKLAVICGYFFVLDLTAYSWFIFSETLQNSSIVNTQKKRILWGLPYLALGVLTVMLLRTDWLNFDPNAGLFQNGPIFWVQLILAFGYVLFTTFSAFLRASYKKNFANRGKYLALGCFGLFPLFFGFSQVILREIPLFPVGVTFGALLVYFYFQEQLISTDALTNLNNRSRMVKHLSARMQNADKEKPLYLFIVDLDNFKFINDRFGHIEGDHALVDAATILKTVAAKNDCFLARYGGDEFILMTDFANEQEAIALKQEIAEAFRAFNETHDLPYELEASIGYAHKTDDIEYIPDFIRAADTSLYEAKSLRKEQATQAMNL